MTKAYFDTCIVSGLAKEDLPEVEQAALLEVLRLYRAEKIELVTSALVKQEIDRIPEKPRRRHEIIYNLLADIPISNVSWTDSGLMMMGCGGGTRFDPLYSELRSILPDEADAQHIFQAIKNGAYYFVTTDRRTILRYAKMLQDRFGIRFVTPAELVKALEDVKLGDHAAE
jgi:predicted nucleic acid-binding protein